MINYLPNHDKAILLEFYLVIVSIFLLIGWSIALYKKRFTLSDADKKTEKRMILSLITAITLVTGFGYFSMSKQGAQNLAQNPYKLVHASALAPNFSKVSSPEDVEEAVRNAKDGTVVVVYKFGCPDCQRFYQYARKNKQLLPSKSRNVLWIPVTNDNKTKSDLVDDANAYPTVYLWRKNGENGQVRMVKYEEPNEEERQQIANYVNQVNR